MSGVLLGVPSYAPPGGGADPLPGMTLAWHGWDGTVWELNGRRARGIRMQSGMRGLTFPKGQHTIDEPAGVAGGRWRGWRTTPREVFWPLWVWEDSGSQEWLDYDAAFWHSLDPRYSGQWVVTQPNGQKRSLTCRLVDDGDQPWDAMPGLRTWGKYGITLLAEQPYWSSPSVVKWFEPSEDSDFIPPGGGPPFVISEGSTLDSAKVANKGDHVAWATWWATDFTTLTVGVDGQTVVVPFSVADDKLLVVDTNPEARTAIEIDMWPPEITAEGQVAWVASHLAAGTDRTGELGEATGFGPIPAGASVDLTIAMVGTGKVRVAFEPRHWRAW